MKRQFVRGLVAGMVLGMCSVSWTAGYDPPAVGGVLAGIEPGVPVTLRDVGTAYEVRVSDTTLPLPHRVVEVGADYLVIRSVSEIETRIPLVAIKAVVRLPKPGSVQQGNALRP